MAQADDGVHRGADFVAHIGEEFTLGMVGRFRRLLGMMKFFLHLLALGDIFDKAFQIEKISIGAKHFTSSHVNCDDTMIFSPP